MATSRIMCSRRIALSLVALCGLGLGANLLVRADEPNKDLVIWNGDDKTAGGGWATPKDDPNVWVKPNDQENHGGKKSLEFHAQGAKWMGFGWNWHNWWPAGSGTNISTADRLSFWVKVTGDKKPADFTVHIASSNAKGTSDVNLSKYVKDAKPFTDGEWHQIVVPLKDLYGDKTEFDNKLAWEIQFGEWSEDEAKFSFFVDQIQFLTPDQK